MYFKNAQVKVSRAVSADDGGGSQTATRVVVYESLAVHLQRRTGGVNFAMTGAQHLPVLRVGMFYDLPADIQRGDSIADGDVEYRVLEAVNLGGWGKFGRADLEVVRGA